MSEVRWKPELESKSSLRLEEMDRQHRVLTALIHGLGKRAAQGASKAELSDILEQLSDYTVRHFQVEEAYMEATSYPKLDTHQLIHRDLLLKLREHVSEFEAGSGKLGHRLTSFLKFWLAAHINSVDMYFAGHVRHRSA
jgi:hemerythrin-like metal-binding protein